MGQIGRARVHVMFWTWYVGPFFCTSDLASFSGGKSVSSVGSCSFSLYPRKVPLPGRGGRVQRSNYSYLDVLAPNDWVIIIIEPRDGGNPEPLFQGFIDLVSTSMRRTQTGMAVDRIEIKASSWEKAFRTISAVSDPWISRYINIANMYNIALRGTNAVQDDPSGLQTTRDAWAPLTTRAIANIVEVFLRADQSDTARENMAADRGRTREDAESWSMAALIGEAVDASEYPETLSDTEDNRVAPEGAEEAGIATLMGQFELPNRGGARRPFWDFLRLRFEAVDESVNANPQQLVNMLSRPLIAFIDEWSNPMMNAVIYDVRNVERDGLSHLREGHNLETEIAGGYAQDAVQSVVDAAWGVSADYGRVFQEIAPHMILMKRPLFADELMAMDGPFVSATQFHSINLGRSDQDLYNLTMIEIASLSGPQMRMVAGLTGFDADRRRAVESIRRHGLRLLNDQTNSWPNRNAREDAPTVANYDMETVRPWNERLQRAGLDAPDLYSGSARIKDYLPEGYLGGKMVISFPEHPGLFAEGKTLVFYVDGIGFSYDGATGVFEEEFTLVRGYEAPAWGSDSGRGGGATSPPSGSIGR